MHLLALLLCKIKKKKTWEQIQSHEDVPFLDQND